MSGKGKGGRARGGRNNGEPILFSVAEFWRTAAEVWQEEEEEDDEDSEEITSQDREPEGIHHHRSRGG